MTEQDIFSQMGSLVSSQIIADDLPDRLRSAVQRERSENLTCPLADHIEIMTARAINNPGRAFELLSPLLMVIAERDEYFGP